MGQRLSLGATAPQQDPGLMNPGETSDPVASSEPRPRIGRWIDRLAALFLFSATAVVVVWQNARLAVLWDLSYTLENSYRISLGDIPYRDFPFAHAPLTFLIQAALIKLTGHVYWHHIAYCAVIGGLSTLLTWRILHIVLRHTVAHARLLAFLLSLPLIRWASIASFRTRFMIPIARSSSCSVFSCCYDSNLGRLLRRALCSPGSRS